MDNDIIIEKVTPYLRNNNELFSKDFSNLFSFSSTKEQYLVILALLDNNIVIISEDVNKTLGSEKSKSDIIVDEGDIDAIERLKDAIKECISDFSEREQKLMKLRFGLDDKRTRTRDEVVSECNVTREIVKRTEMKIKRRFSHCVRSKKLKDFLEGN